MAISRPRALQRRLGEALVHHQVTILALLLASAAGLLRLFQIDAYGFNLDEVWSLWMAQKDVGAIITTTLFENGDATPPTYYILLHPLLSFGQDPAVLRALSVLAGALIVWLTFELASFLFDQRVAWLSAILVAVAPIHVQYSQLARAYMLAALWAIFSLYFFSRILFGSRQRRPWIWLIAASAAALYTHYLTILVVVVENGLILALWLGRRLTTATARSWGLSQAILGLLLVPAGLAAAYTFWHVVPGRGQTWLPRPGLQSAIKSTILFGTGDPSYGHAGSGITLERAASLLLILGLAALAGWLVIRKLRQPAERDEALRLLWLAGAVAGPFLLAFAISQVRPIYHEKYFTFLVPPLLIIFAWTLLRLPYRRVTVLGLLVLVALIGRSLYVHYTQPYEEQWREAVGYLRQGYQPGDAIVIAPAFYIRAFSYYFSGSFPDDVRPLSHQPALLVHDGRYEPLADFPPANAGPSSAEKLGSFNRIWIVTGETGPDSALLSWIEQRYETGGSLDFYGASVRLWQRPTTDAPRGLPPIRRLARAASPAMIQGQE